VPYELGWLDEGLRVFALRLYDPLTAEEADELRRELASLIQPTAPIFVLLDIRQFDLMEALSRLGSAFEGIRIPRDSETSLGQSRVAVIGGGAFLKMLLSLAGDRSDYADLARTFTHEDQAYTWLREAALAARPSPGPDV
jgi:hypothetical protein